MSNLQPPWLVVAEAELGVHEKPGADHEARIVEYHSYTHLAAKDDETSWCSSFVNFCMARAFGYGAKTWLLDAQPGTGQANARSWLGFGVALPMTCPAYGCVVVFWRERRESWKGHVGILLDQSRDKVTVLGGNQGNAVSIREYPKARVLGYRWAR